MHNYSSFGLSLSHKPPNDSHFLLKNHHLCIKLTSTVAMGQLLLWRVARQRPDEIRPQSRENQEKIKINQQMLTNIENINESHAI